MDNQGKKRGAPFQGDRAKERLNIRIDGDLKAAAQEMGINFSQLMEDAIRKAIRRKHPI